MLEDNGTTSGTAASWTIQVGSNKSGVNPCGLTTSVTRNWNAATAKLATTLIPTAQLVRAGPYKRLSKSLSVPVMAKQSLTTPVPGTALYDPLNPLKAVAVVGFPFKSKK